MLTEVINEARALFPDDGNKMFIRNNDTKTAFYMWSDWLFKKFNKAQLNKLQIGESTTNSAGTRITRIY